MNNKKTKTVVKVTTPREKINPTALDKHLKRFEEKLKEEEDGQEYYFLVVTGEINLPTRRAIEKAYLNAGWSKVICKTSSENGERPGLTGLQLYI